MIPSLTYLPVCWPFEQGHDLMWPLSVASDKAISPLSLALVLSAPAAKRASNTSIWPTKRGEEKGPFRGASWAHLCVYRAGSSFVGLSSE